MHEIDVTFLNMYEYTFVFYYTINTSAKNNSIHKVVSSDRKCERMRVIGFLEWIEGTLFFA